MNDVEMQRIAEQKRPFFKKNFRPGKGISVCFRNNMAIFSEVIIRPGFVQA